MYRMWVVRIQLSAMVETFGDNVLGIDLMTGSLSLF